jgi:hypothetical protein
MGEIRCPNSQGGAAAETSSEERLWLLRTLFFAPLLSVTLWTQEILRHILGPQKWQWLLRNQPDSMSVHIKNVIEGPVLSVQLHKSPNYFNKVKNRLVLETACEFQLCLFCVTWAMFTGVFLTCKAGGQIDCLECFVRVMCRVWGLCIVPGKMSGGLSIFLSSNIGLQGGNQGPIN